MLANRTMGGGLNAPSFWLELLDAGAGAVNTTPSLANGSPTATFTRATTAWTKLSTGLWASVASGTARSCYLGMTTAVGAYAGYLAEGAATQLVTPTASIRDMTNAAWSKGATITVAKTGTGIDGVVNSCSRVTGGAVTGTNTVLQTLAAAATSRTYSCWIQRVTGTGAIGICQDGSTFTDISGSLTSANFVQVQLNASQLNASFGIQISTNGDVVLVDFNQFEAGGFGTSPLDAAGAVRNQDLLSYAIAGNFSNTSGSCYAEYASTSGLSSTNYVIADGAGGATAPLFIVSPTQSAGAYDGTTQIQITQTGGTSIIKGASSWGSGRSVTSQGLSVGTGAFDGTYNFAGSFRIGARTGNEMFGTVKNVKLWASQLADSQLVSLTQ